MFNFFHHPSQQVLGTGRSAVEEINTQDDQQQGKQAQPSNNPGNQTARVNHTEDGFLLFFFNGLDGRFVQKDWQHATGLTLKNSRHGFRVTVLPNFELFFSGWCQCTGALLAEAVGGDVAHLHDFALYSGAIGKKELARFAGDAGLLLDGLVGQVDQCFHFIQVIIGGLVTEAIEAIFAHG